MLWLILLHVFAVLIALVLPLFFDVDAMPCYLLAHNIVNATESIQHKFFAYKNYFRWRRFPYNRDILLIFYLHWNCCHDLSQKIEKKVKTTLDTGMRR